MWQRQKAAWRESLLQATLVWSILLTLMVEITSLVNLIRWWAWGIIWGLILTFLIGKLFRDKANILSLFKWPHQFNKMEILLISCLIFYLSLLLLVAATAVPNTWDSMTYHLPRIMHWLHDHSVTNYPTNILRQLYQSPWAEYAVMNWMLLSGNDTFANLVQWTAMVGSLIGGSLIAKEMGLNRAGQLVTAVVIVTIPMGMMQATSTQNDYVTALWLVIAMYYAIVLTEKFNWSKMIWFSAAVGLALLTKGTAYIYSLPILVYMGIIWARQLRHKAWRPILVTGSVILLLNGFYYARNLALFHSPLGSKSISQMYKNADYYPNAIAANIIKNAALHLQFTDKKLDKDIEKSVKRICDNLGVSCDDPKYTWHNTVFKLYSVRKWDEDSAGNTYHFLLSLVAVLIFIVMLLKIKMPFVTTSYICIVAVMFILFCSYLKWQPWHSRLHLPIFVLLVPFMVKMFSKIKVPGSLYIIASFLLLTSLPGLFKSHSRPLIGEQSIFHQSRYRQYFNANPKYYDEFKKIDQILTRHSWKRIGLIWSEDTWEYPLWLNQNGVFSGRTITHIAVENESGKYASNNNSSEVVDCIIIAKKALNKWDKTDFKNKYHEMLSLDDFRIFY